MASEEELISKLKDRFPELAQSVYLQRSRRIWAQAPADSFRALIEFAVKDLGYSMLCTITGLDDGDNLLFLYHLARPDGKVLSLKLAVPKSDPKINSVTDLFPQALYYERELRDLLGALVDVLANDTQSYPLPDGWPQGQHPLRKDFIPEVLEQSSANTSAEGAKAQ